MNNALVKIWGHNVGAILMAKDCGIDMMPCRLFEENGRAHFLTKRFDRKGNTERLHTQTLCAMNHMDFNNNRSYSYEQLFPKMHNGYRSHCAFCV